MWAWAIPVPHRTAVTASSIIGAILDAWFEAMGLTEKVILVVHDWGSALGFRLGAAPPRARVGDRLHGGDRAAIQLLGRMAAATRAFFQGQRSDAGEDLILRQNLFIEYLLPLRHIPEEAIEVYRRHYRNPGPARMPMLAWTRDLPIAGEPADVVAIVDDYARWLSTSSIPKLFIDADPAGFLIGAQREFCRGLAEPGDGDRSRARTSSRRRRRTMWAEALARFVAKVRAGPTEQVP